MWVSWHKNLGDFLVLPPLASLVGGLALIRRQLEGASMLAGRFARHLVLSTPLVLPCWREVAASASHAFGSRKVGHVRPPFREPLLGPRERYDPFAAATLAALDGCIRNMAGQRSALLERLMLGAMPADDAHPRCDEAERDHRHRRPDQPEALEGIVLVIGDGDRHVRAAREIDRIQAWIVCNLGSCGLITMTFRDDPISTQPLTRGAIP
jgi:hypothetical protein